MDKPERSAGTDDTDPAFSAIYQEYAPRLFAYFYRQVGHRQDAEDLTATTFSKALVSIERYTEQGAFEAWLWSIARHTLRDAQRRHRQSDDIERVAFQLIDPAQPAEDQVLQAEQQAMVRRLLNELPTDQRDALILRFFREWSFHDIAQSLGRSIGAAKMLVQRALATIRTHHQQLDGSTAATSPDYDPGSIGAPFHVQYSLTTSMAVLAQSCWHVLRPQPVLVLQPVRISAYNPALPVARRRR